MIHLVIRADGDPDIGYGHLVRTSSVAEKLLSQGHTVTYATATPDQVRQVCPESVDVVSLPTRGNPGPFVEWLEVANPDVAFTDAYPINTGYQREVRDRAPLVVQQDDDRHPVCADVFTNGNVYADELQYEFVGPEPRTCLGTDYVLLREEIARLAARKPPWRPIPECALITMGGSDLGNFTPGAVRAFDGLHIRVDAVIGPGFSAAQERQVRDAAADVSADVRVTCDPPDLPERMYEADFAVCTASSTTYELLALGTPIIAIPQAANQKLVADALAARNLAEVLPDDPATSTIRGAVQAYMSGTELRHERQTSGKYLIDGCGAGRIAEEIRSLTEDSEQV